MISQIASLFTISSMSSLLLYLSVHGHLGLKDQATKIPLRFFIEQLLKRNKIVFTGTCI